ncbi:MAG TPA: energy transducer TonB [Saprospiraceae bacterium]|nr:energy transducer TonB [Saprospiraceae bacterium]HMQ82654.1 energy transducer TonB [Saprospiraceae bacterium]
MEKERKGKDFIHQPVYKGGPKAMSDFIKQHLRYPEEALSNGIEGTVYLTYTINNQGKVVDVRIITALGYGCDEEAARVVRLLQFEVPKNRGVKVLFNKKLKIPFKMARKKVEPRKDTPVSFAVQYIYTTGTVATPSNEKKEDSSPGGYTFSIKLG